MHGQKRPPHSLLPLILLDLLAHCVAGEGRFPGALACDYIVVSVELGTPKPKKPAPSDCPLESWLGGSAGWPPLTGKALCFHSQSVSIRIKEKGEMQFFWCQTGRKTLQRTGGNEAIMHKEA